MHPAHGGLTVVVLSTEAGGRSTGGRKAAMVSKISEDMVVGEEEEMNGCWVVTCDNSRTG